MTNDEKLEKFAEMLDEEVDTKVLSVYLQQAKSLILNTRFPYGCDSKQDIEPRYENLQIELAIVLYNEKGVEGQSSHSENGIARVYRSKNQILAEITPKCGVL